MNTLTIEMVKRTNKDYFKVARQFGDKSHQIAIMNGQAVLMIVQNREIGPNVDWHYSVLQVHDNLTIGKEYADWRNTFQTRKECEKAAQDFVETYTGF